MRAVLNETMPVGCLATGGVSQTAQATPSAAERGRRVYSALFTPASRKIAIAGLVVSALMPPDGVGFTICLLKRMTGLPCPACGLTRSMACITHLSPGAAWAYHPFGPLVYALLVALAVSQFLGEPRRRRIEQWFMAHGKGAHFVYWALVASFLVFGVVRLFVAWMAPGSVDPRI
jgi:hypothetical protein